MPHQVDLRCRLGKIKIGPVSGQTDKDEEALLRIFSSSSMWVLQGVMEEVMPVRCMVHGLTCRCERVRRSNQAPARVVGCNKKSCKN